MPLAATIPRLAFCLLSLFHAVRYITSQHPYSARPKNRRPQHTAISSRVQTLGILSTRRSPILVYQTVSTPQHESTSRSYCYVPHSRNYTFTLQYRGHL
ncbi:hypothetical protein EDB85DRAFT_1432575 [Lactarius pseudohatsudake]|nr:hypothetical protein EDB85DRAFT_1432575 [Lactarius pseudohatsudake]